MQQPSNMYMLYLNFQISMSVQLPMVAVTKSVPTQSDHFSVAVTVDSFFLVTRGLVWISMNALLMLMAVAKYVQTQLGHFAVAVTVDSHSQVTEGLVWRITSAPLGLITASSVVSTLRVDSDVNATQAFSSTQIKGVVLVRPFTSVSAVTLFILIIYVCMFRYQ